MKSTEIKRVSYTFNSVLEDQGLNGYFLDCLVSRDGELLVDIHQSYRTREEFYEAMEGVLPLLESVAITEVEGEHGKEDN